MSSCNNDYSNGPGQSMVSAVPASLVNYMTLNSNNTMNHQGFEFPEVSNEIKKVVKKDRHSKIYTAQGLRDRRVRLSIGIARQFFDLQDMLGFDKASKTLEWLLKKSEKDIKEVVQTKTLNNDDDGNKSFVYGSSQEYCEEEEVKKAEKRKKNSKLSNFSPKPLRAKGKGKEKERTRELVYDHPETVSEITQSEIMDPFTSSIIFKEGEDMTHSFYKEAIEEFNNQESILTNQHNIGTFIMTDQSSMSNNNIILPQILDYNYDLNPFVDQTLCAVTNTNFPRGFP